MSETTTTPRTRRKRSPNKPKPVNALTDGITTKAGAPDFFSKVPGVDKVVFERRRTSAHSARMERINKRLPEGYVGTLIDNTPANQGQIALFESEGWLTMPMATARSLGIHEDIPANQILMVVETAVKEKRQRDDEALAKSRTTAMPVKNDGGDVTVQGYAIAQQPIQVPVSGLIGGD